MGSLLKSTFNTRFIPSGDNRYLRSDCPSNLTDDEVKWLKDNNIVTVVDLRKEEEYTLKPCRLEHEEGFNYLHMPVTGGWDIPTPTIKEVTNAYIAMVDEHMFHIVDTIMNVPSKVLYFCAAGKDRTGIVSAIILKRLGVDEKIIIDDYLKSKPNSLAYVKAYMEKHHPDVPLKPILSDRRYIKAVLKLIK